MKGSSFLHALLGASCLAAVLLTGCPDEDREGDGILKPLDTFDADTNPPPDTSIVKVEVGEPCQQNDDCVSNVCANASGEGRICTQACGEGNT